MSIFTQRSGATSHPEDTVLQFYTDFVLSSGVLLLGADHFKVTEDTVQSMILKVKTGRAYLKKLNSNARPVRSDSDSTVTIASNSSGNARKDAVVLYLDLSATPNNDGTGVALLSVVQGTPSASPSAPTDNEIATSIGASNPFLRLADVLVDSGVGIITNAKVTDQRVRVRFGRIRPTVVDDTYASTITFDYEQGEVRNITLTGNPTLAISNIQPGDFILLRLKQDATGNRTISAWWSGISWDDGVEPVITPTANKTTIIGVLCVAKGAYEGFTLGENR